MKQPNWMILWLLILLQSSFLLVGCQSSEQQSEEATLRLAVIPVLDTLPMYVADKEGLYEKHGVTVEFIPITSAPERDALIASGQADGMVNEALSTLTRIRSRPR
jgi:NitT/TauT family transport system substrate-binding protein